MEDKQCASRCGDYRCQLPACHKEHFKKHEYLGTPDDPCSIRWTTAGAERVNTEKNDPFYFRSLREADKQ